MTDERSTIFALSSGHGRAGVAVIRVSGPAAQSALTEVAGCVPVPRVATMCWLRSPGTLERLDQGLVLWFPGMQSFTGEPVAEFHSHGGQAVIGALLEALAQIPGLRLAEPGEFTRRAVENGKLDLTRAEALADLLAADTEMQRRQALAGLEGRLSRTVRGWRQDILSLKALIAADIDFADQEDASDISYQEVRDILRRLSRDMTAVLLTAERGRLVVGGFKVAIVGRPNVGKSSLLNALAGSDIAIVTEFPGTTRDLLEVRLDLGGLPVRVIDTAGIRESTDPVETLGVERARKAAQDANLVLLLDDGTGAHPNEFGWVEADVVRVRSKSDLIATDQGAMEPDASTFHLSISSLRGSGLPELVKLIALHAERSIDKAVEPAILAHKRQETAIRAAQCEVNAALIALETSAIELVDEHTRRMDHELDRLLGFVGVEEVLGAIFSRFCIGK